MSKPKELPDQELKSFSDSVLFYIFYNMPNDRTQILAALQLQDRGWVYVEEEMVWVKQSGIQFSRFNPYAWQEEPLV